MSRSPYHSPTRPLRRSAATALAATSIAALLSAGLAAIESPSEAMAAPAAFAGYTDKSALESAGRAVVSSGALQVQDGTAPVGDGVAYYVDSDGGDDEAAGTSPASAWKSFANINGRTFEAGDRILLKAGGVWTAEGTTIAAEAYDYTTWSGDNPTDVEGPDATAMLAPGGSGTAGSPIVISSYGDGAAPELNGRGVVNDVLQLTNQSHWDISNLEISNFADGFDPTRFTPASANGQIPGEEDPLTGDVRGIHVQGENAGTLSGYDIHNVFIRDVSGVSWSVSGSGLDRSKRTGGILFEGLKGDGLTVSQFEDVSIRDSFIANTSFANLTFKQFAGMGTNRYQDREPGWGDRAVAKAATDGTITEDPDWRPHRGIEISGNYLTNRNTQYGWDSMYLTSVQGATVSDNLVDGSGVSGIEMYYSDDVVVENNEVAEVELRPGAADSNGIDPDRGTSNILIQGNYVHDSGEGILLCGFGFSTAVVRYNVIQDVDKNYINPHGDSGVNVIYNNLMYNTQAPSKNNTVGFFESSGSASEYLVAKNPHHVLNNVFLNTRESVSGAAFRTEFPGVRFSNNSYFGPRVVAPAADAAATSTDPLLGGNPASDIANAAPASFQSPLLGAGAAVDLAALAPGFDATGAYATTQNIPAVDFFGSPLTNPPHIGPASYEPSAGFGLVTGIVSAPDGVPVGGAVVSVGEQTVTADASGRYALEAQVGDYVLTPSAPDYESGAAVPVTLGDRAIVRADLVLGDVTTTRGAVSGSVTGKGAGLADVTVVLASGTTTVAEATTDSSGDYVFDDVEQGDDYTVTAAKPGFQTATSPVSVVAARTARVDLVLVAEVGETTYVLNETFDDEAVGSFSESHDGALIARTASAGTVMVAADAGNPGSNYLRINKSSSSSAVLGVHNATELNLTGTVTIEARLQRTTTNGAPNQVALYSYTESNWNDGAPASSTNPAATVGFSNGKIMTHNVTGASTVKNVADYVAGRWYTVRNVVDLDAGTFDFYLDDMSTPLLVDQPLRTKVDDLDYFFFYVNGSNVGDLLVDYFRVNTGTPYEFADTSLAAVSATADGADVALVPAADGASYTGTVDPLTDSVSISATATSGFARVSIDGTDVAPGESIDVELDEGAPADAEIATSIPVVVTAENGEQRTFTVVITRVNPNQSTALRALAVDGYTISPTFEPGRSGAENAYVVDGVLDPGVATVTLVWRRGWEGQPVQVAGRMMAGDATQAVVPLVDGENRIEVTSGSYAGDLRSYVIEVVRAAAPVLPDAWAATAVYGAGDLVSNDGRVFEALWYTSGEVPGSQPFGAWAEIAVAADGTAVWTATRVFNAGERVVHEGRTYEARWYTRGTEPGGVGWVWSEIVPAAPGETPAWSAATVYTGGEQVSYDGQVYEARWYTAGETPDPAAEWGVWKPIG